MHKDGCACISIRQESYDYEKHRYEETYFEEENQEDVLSSDRFKKIANKQVDHFNVIGGGIYKVELCIYLKEEQGYKLTGYSEQYPFRILVDGVTPSPEYLEMIEKYKRGELTDEDIKNLEKPYTIKD